MQPKISSLTQERVKQLFNYDADTGVLTWKFTYSARAMKGSIAGCRRQDGRLVLRIDKELYMAYRIIWLWMTGSWPAADIDHIDRDFTNNRWSNLRDVNRSTNLHNKASYGVRHETGSSTWIASITVAGKLHHIGSYITKEEAELAYNLAKDKVISILCLTSQTGVI